jgi:hypothetical protein
MILKLQTSSTEAAANHGDLVSDAQSHASNPKGALHHNISSLIHGVSPRHPSTYPTAYSDKDPVVDIGYHVDQFQQRPKQCKNPCLLDQLINLLHLGFINHLV